MAHILIIDDSVSVLALLESILSPAGHRVTTTTSGKEGLQQITTGSVDLVITDVYMPEQDGMEVIRETLRLRPTLPVIAMSSKSGPLNLFTVARALGAVTTLQKPFSRDELLTAVSFAVPESLRPIAISTPSTDKNISP